MPLLFHKLEKMADGAWCACPGVGGCTGTPPSPKKLLITDVMSLAVAKVLKLLVQCPDS